MTVKQICSMIHLPSEVTEEVERYWNGHAGVIDQSLEERLLKRESWDEAIKEIRTKIGEDKNGFCMLAELLKVGLKTYGQYQEAGISDEVFVRTMEFCTRFINRHKQLYGHYAFVWDWWFPRQLALQEFRIEELEFEFVDFERKQISIHIPSDADMRPLRVKETLCAYRKFLKRYFPEWTEADLYCESWMLSPALEELLDESSNVLSFKRLFEIEFVDEESMAVLDWVFPGERVELKDLKEGTSLQKKMKAFFLNGGKVGWTKGKLKGGVSAF